MKDITNEVKDFKKFYIIPKEEVAMEVHSANADDAMSCFAWAMDSDMNQYFRAVTEEEYNEYKKEKRHDQFVEWATDIILDDFSEYRFNTEEAQEIAEKAHEIYCEAGSYPYCDIETEYEAVTRAVEEYREERD